MKNSQSDRDNRSNQLNQNNDAYWQSRGHDSNPNKDSDADENSGGDGIERILPMPIPWGRIID